MPKSRVPGGRRVHRRLVHKRAQIQQLARTAATIRNYAEEIIAAGDELSEHHREVHADCKWPVE
jgi:hypothetical protein